MLLLRLVCPRRVLVVGGKGGVGKTAVASAVALAQARAGRRVRLVSTDPAHNLGHLWQQPVGDDGAEVAPGLDAVEIDPARTTEAHLAAVGATLRRLMPDHLHGAVDRHLALARDAPGMHEAAVLERVAEAVEDGMDRYDLTVLDTAPSGHTARLMALPDALSAWTEGLLRRQDRSRRMADAEQRLTRGSRDRLGDVLGGTVDAEDAPPSRTGRDEEIRRVLLRRRDRFERLRDTFTDPALTTFVVVLAAERLPVLETIELHGHLRASGVDVGALVVNKRSPADAGELLAARRAQEEEHLRTVREALPDVPTVEVPLLPQDLVGAAALERFAGELGLLTAQAR